MSNQLPPPSSAIGRSIHKAADAAAVRILTAVYSTSEVDGLFSGLGSLAALNTVDTTEIADDAVTADKLANTAVTPGAYTAADITVDAQGRITAAASGSFATTSRTITAGTGLTGGGDLSADRTIALSSTNVDKLATLTVTTDKVAIDRALSLGLFDHTIAANELDAPPAGSIFRSTVDGLIYHRLADGSTHKLDNEGLSEYGHTHIIADVTGLQSALDGHFTEAVATASPNNTVNNVSLTAVGDTTNVSVAIVPKGTGAFSLQVPDGTTAGGNVRGASAVDLQTDRGAANQVASGLATFVCGRQNRASGNFSAVVGNANVSSSDATFASGQQTQATGVYSTAMGNICISSGGASFAVGSNNTASGFYTLAFGFQSLADRLGQLALSGGQFAAKGDAQSTTFVVRNKTTDATPTTLFLNGASTRLTIPSGKILSANILISGIKSDGSARATFWRKVVITNVGGTTTLDLEIKEYDAKDNPLTDVTITADDANDALQINVTGIAAETWRWVAVVEGLEIGYGT